MNASSGPPPGGIPAHRHNEADLTNFANLEFHAGELPKHRIRDHLRQQILSGALRTGERIPPVRTLAALWQTNIATVHFAFTDLLRQGLILRRHGHGTYVADHIRSLQAAAIYFTPEMISDPFQWFGRSLWMEIRNVLTERGVKPEAWIDQRDDPDQVCSELETAVRDRLFQGVILLAAGCAPWMKGLSIPIAAMTSLSLPFAVSSDTIQFAQESVRRLTKAGCRSLGVIAAVPMEENTTFYRAIHEAAASHGMDMRGEWLRAPRQSLALSNHGAFGYDELKTLWLLSERPEGLIVFPDRMVEGVIFGMTELGVHAPKDIKLVLHRNESYPFIHPVAAIYAVSREREYAEALVQQLERQIAGESIERILLPYHFIEETPGAPL